MPTVGIWPKVTLKAVVMKANYGVLNVMCLFVALRHVLIVLKIFMPKLSKFIKFRHSSAIVKLVVLELLYKNINIYEANL